jgi:hypothetical protein
MRYVLAALFVLLLSPAATQAHLSPVGSCLVQSGGTKICPTLPVVGERQPYCADQGNAFQAIYGYPAGTTSKYSSRLATIRAAIGGANQLLHDEAIASGRPGHADLRYTCTTGLLRKVDVKQWQGPASEDFWTIVAAARATFGRPDRKLVVFWDGRSQFYGGASDGQDSVMFQCCFNAGTTLHESGHQMRAVNQAAPFSDGGAHCYDGLDVMCYSSDPRYFERCRDRTHFDCGFDTYYDAAPEKNEWLDLNPQFNVGNAVYNLFVRFG